ncbi:MAG: hypothetical protein IJK23_12125 [Clostridia bacterium]|nr:hypothetical protein [Clostridia bacterium]
MKRIIVFALAIFALFTANAGKGLPDSYAAYDFPIIKAENQAPGTLRIMSFNIRVGGVNGNTTYDRITIGESKIFEIMPDSFGLQEASNIWMVALDGRLTMYDWVGCEIDAGGDVKSAMIGSRQTGFCECKINRYFCSAGNGYETKNGKRDPDGIISGACCAKKHR